jgi:CubicO group peptidase (beta-lactamase class C family)
MIMPESSVEGDKSMDSDRFRITRNLFIAVFAFIYMGVVPSYSAAQFEWKTTRPESKGLSTGKLNSLKESLAAKNTKALLVIRNDSIVCEWYANGHGPDKKHYTASLAKALVGGMSLLITLNDGLIAVDDPAYEYVPQWKDDPKRCGITIRHLATHSSGIEDAEQDDIVHMKLPGWKGGFWRKDPDPFTLSRDQAPIVFAPGTEYAYSNPGMAMLSYTVTASLRDTKHTDIRTLLRERIMRPIGVKDGEWSIGYGKTYEVEDLNLVATWGGGSYTARAIARVGRLMLKKGNWRGKQLIDRRWVEKVLRYAETPKPERPPGNPQPACGLGWYTNFDAVWPKVPRDAFAGAGAGNQVLLVVPSLDLIVIRNGGNLYDPSKAEGFWGGLEKHLFNPVIAALIESDMTVRL